MSNINRDSLLKRVFTDTKNYPYGFSRSGDFSISESKALSEYGSLIAALVDGHIKAESDDDLNYLAAAHGEIEPQNVVQRAWVKYQKRINRPKTGSIYGTRKTSSSDRNEALVNELDDDLDLDLDD